MKASRLHTLPLAVCGILLGNMAAAYHHIFSWPVLIFSLLTAVLYQVISNFANDYGDFVHGADSEERKGPERMVQSGAITKEEMKVGIIITSIIAVFSTAVLLWLSFPVIGWTGLSILFALGILSIIAAITYTASSNPYGYRGFGDLAVFLFFGLLAVMGSYYLHSGVLNIFILLLAITFGLFSAAVLNVNNLRDLHSDKEAGKLTLAVHFGPTGGKLYHSFLILTGAAFFIYFVAAFFSWVWVIAALAFLLPAFYNLLVIWKIDAGEGLAPCLKQMVLACISYAAGAILVMLQGVTS